MMTEELTRQKVVNAILRAIEVDKLRLAITSDDAKKDITEITGVTADELDTYLSEEVTFELDGKVIRNERRAVLSAMHACC